MVFILRKMPNAERPYKGLWLSVGAVHLITVAICMALLYTKPSTCGWGVIMLLVFQCIIIWYENRG
jgi:APA family basic amino acid/polyamine antiporter